MTAAACGRRGDDLRRVADAVPIATDRLEGVVHRHRGIAEMLDLLQHRVWQPVGKRITGEQQHGQAVGVGHTRRGHHIQCSGPNRRCRDHDLTPPLGLSEADGGQRHRLLVLSAPGRQRVLHGLQRFRQAGYVAMSENAEDTGK